MSLDLLQEIAGNRSILILLEEREYPSKLEEIIKSMEKTKTRICYVCLSKPYTDVMEDLKNKDIDPKDFFFIDVLTSHYKEPEPVDNCIFVPEPDLSAIRVAIKKAVEEKKRNVILFDTISTLLIYQKISSIIKFTHQLLTEENENVKKLFIALKGDSTPLEEIQRLVKDMTMFADKTLDLGMGV